MKRVIFLLLLTGFIAVVTGGSPPTQSPGFSTTQLVCDIDDPIVYDDQEMMEVSETIIPYAWQSEGPYMRPYEFTGESYFVCSTLNYTSRPLVFPDSPWMRDFKQSAISRAGA